MGDHGAYTMIKTGGEPRGGIMATPQPGVPTAWTTYVLVGDVAAALKRVEKLGGKVLMGKTEIPGMGHFGVLADPTGGVLAVWQAGQK
jgi:hypothetical protein